MKLSTKRFITGRLKENCYIINDEAGNAVAIDPGGDAEVIIRYLFSECLQVKAIINTHGHFDHIGAVEKIKGTFGAPFYMHSRDEGLLKNANLYSYLFDSQERVEIPGIDVSLDTTERLNFGGLEVQIIETPGHTPGGVSFLIGGQLFTGDTLFNNRVGRTDLPGGDKSALRQSLLSLSKYPPRTIIYPGHGDPGSLHEALSSGEATDVLSQT